MRVGVLRRSGALRAALLALFMTLFVVQPLARPADAVTMFGNDISWPQCPSPDGFGNPMPPATAQFVIVGLAGPSPGPGPRSGLAFIENPCLADQVKWVRDRSKPAHAYAMATFPTSAQEATYGSAGPWQPTTRRARLSNVGYAEAQFAVASMGRIGWRPPMVWIDVEPRPVQEWLGTPTPSAAEVLYNRFVIEGLMRGLHDAGFSYGIYSYTNGWHQIVGDWYLPTVPAWVPAGSLDYPDEALDLCSKRSFSGARVYIAQWVQGNLDYDRTCSWYSFTDPQMPPAIMTGSLHDWDADWTDDLLRLSTSGALTRYPGDGAGGIGAGIPVSGSWTATTTVAGPGDLTGDRRHDLLALDTSGRLWLHPGNGHGGLGTRSLIGSGWSVMRKLITAGDMTSDGRADLLALDTSGRLWLYRGTDRGTFSPRTLVQSGWTAMADAVGVGDLTLDRRADVVALDTSGRLWLYPGTGTGGLGTRVQLATGWRGARLIGPGDITGDRLVDLAVLNPAGTVAVYPGTAAGRLGARAEIATGWTGVRAAV
jgi:hypothetical protein